MPLLDLICSCGHHYEALKSFSTVDPDLHRCPKCGGTPERAPAAGVFRREATPNDMPALELQEHLDAKAYYESDEVAAKVLSGELGLAERGPKWLRPQCPEKFRKKYF